MTELIAQFPARRPELVSWPSSPNGGYLLRNRATGESFRFEAEEHFLLSRLDGTASLEDICAAFEQRFGEPLSFDDFDEFLRLADEQGLLQDADSPGVMPPPLEQTGSPLPAARRGLSWKRLAAASLKALAKPLGWSVWLPGVLHGWLRRRAQILEYVPRPDDVFIVTYPRSGTTWMQMVLYQLTTDGDVDFPHIAEFCPWFEKSVRSAHGFELRPSPRLFKSHLHHRQIPKGAAKYIYVARDGKDVAVSYFHLYRRYNGYEGTFDQFFERFLRGKVAFGSWFAHVRGWWEHRDDDNVLFLTYEQLKTDFDATVRKIADFCGWELSAEKLERVKTRTSFVFMKQHEHRFDPALETLWEQGVRLEAFLRNGRVGDGVVTLNEEQTERFEKMRRDRLEE